LVTTGVSARGRGVEPVRPATWTAQALIGILTVLEVTMKYMRRLMPSSWGRYAAAGRYRIHS